MTSAASRRCRPEPSGRPERGRSYPVAGPAPLGGREEADALGAATAGAMPIARLWHRLEPSWGRHLRDTWDRGLRTRQPRRSAGLRTRGPDARPRAPRRMSIRAGFIRAGGSVRCGRSRRRSGGPWSPRARAGPQRRADRAAAGQRRPAGPTHAPIPRSWPGSCPSGASGWWVAVRIGPTTRRPSSLSAASRPEPDTASADTRGSPSSSSPARRRLIATQHRTGRARIEWFRDRLAFAGPEFGAVARHDVKSPPGSKLPRRRRTARLGLLTIARLLVDCEPFRVRWALQHWPYSIAKLTRSLMTWTRNGRPSSRTSSRRS